MRSWPTRWDLCLFILALLCVAALVIVTPGCVTPDSAYIRADRLTYEALAPMLVGYLGADTLLPSGTRLAIDECLWAWRWRLEVSGETVEVAP